MIHLEKEQIVEKLMDYLEANPNPLGSIFTFSSLYTNKDPLHFMVFKSHIKEFLNTHNITLIFASNLLYDKPFTSQFLHLFHFENSEAFFKVINSTEQTNYLLNHKEIIPVILENNKDLLNREDEFSFAIYQWAKKVLAHDYHQYQHFFTHWEKFSQPSITEKHTLSYQFNLIQLSLSHFSELNLVINSDSLFKDSIQHNEVHLLKGAILSFMNDIKNNHDIFKSLMVEDIYFDFFEPSAQINTIKISFTEPQNKDLIYYFCHTIFPSSLKNIYLHKDNQDNKTQEKLSGFLEHSVLDYLLKSEKNQRKSLKL